LNRDKPLTWEDLFDSPDHIGRSEYLAFFECIAMAVMDTEFPDPDALLTPNQLEHIESMLDSFAEITVDYFKPLETVQRVTIPDKATLRKYVDMVFDERDHGDGDLRLSFGDPVVGMVVVTGYTDRDTVTAIGPDQQNLDLSLDALWDQFQLEQHAKAGTLSWLYWLPKEVLDVAVLEVADDFECIQGGESDDGVEITEELFSDSVKLESIKATLDECLERSQIGQAIAGLLFRSKTLGIDVRVVPTVLLFTQPTGSATADEESDDGDDAP